MAAKISGSVCSIRMFLEYMVGLSIDPLSVAEAGLATGFLGL